jgi:hypothetical protein
MEEEFLVFEVDDLRLIIRMEVEATGIEPVSKHILQKLSTCLFPYYLSALNRKGTNQFKA